MSARDKADEGGSSSQLETIVSNVADTRRRRGRPATAKVKPPDVMGRVATPQDASSLVEVDSDKPQMYKKVPEIIGSFQYEMWMVFTPAGISVMFRDHELVSWNQLHLPCGAMNRFFIAPDAATALVRPHDPPRPASPPDALWMACSQLHLYDIFKYNTDKVTRVQIAVRRDGRWFFKTFSGSGKSVTSEMPRPPTMSYAPTPGTPAYDAAMYDFNAAAAYMYSFEIPYDELKTLVNRAGDAHISFTRHGLHPLIIKATPKDRPRFWEEYRDAAAFKVVSNMTDKDELAVQVNPKNLRSASNNNIAFMGSVRISLANNRPISICWTAYDAADRVTCSLHSYIVLSEEVGRL